MFSFQPKLIPALLSGILIALLSNCASTSKHSFKHAKMPAARIVDQVVILADTSSTISQEGLLLDERDIIHSFIKNMPEGNYAAGLSAFDTLPHQLAALKAFKRGALLGNLDRMLTMAGSTETDGALLDADGKIIDKSKRTAILIFSDGKFANDVAAILACQDLVAAHEGPICIHTVLIGSDPSEAGMLQRLTGMADCGSFRFGDSLLTEKAIHSFVDDVFFGIKGVPAMALEPAIQDSDGDGVPDDKDKCPDTPKGAKVNADGCWEVPVIYFDYDKSNVRGEYASPLKDVADVLKQNDALKLQIEGHTDNVGSEKYNSPLSVKRANAVKDNLVNNGANDSQMSVKGMGFSKPVKPNTTPENRQANRRVELTPVK